MSTNDDKPVRPQITELISTNDNKPVKPQITELEWITLKQDIGSSAPVEQEKGLHKLKRKFNENPFIPIGNEIY